MTYLDSGVLLKLYVLEADSEHWRQRLSSRTGLLSSTLALLEIKSALRQKTQAKFIRKAGAAEIWRSFCQSTDSGLIRLAPIGADVMDEGVQLLDQLAPSIGLRALEACHLATARLNDCREVATSDARMRSAAVALNIPLLD